MTLNRLRNRKGIVYIDLLKPRKIIVQHGDCQNTSQGAVLPKHGRPNMLKHTTAVTAHLIQFGASASAFTRNAMRNIHTTQPIKLAAVAFCSGIVQKNTSLFKSGLRNEQITRLPCVDKRIQFKLPGCVPCSKHACKN